MRNLRQFSAALFLFGALLSAPASSHAEDKQIATHARVSSWAERALVTLDEVKADFISPETHEALPLTLSREIFTKKGGRLLFTKHENRAQGCDKRWIVAIWRREVKGLRLLKRWKDEIDGGCEFFPFADPTIFHWKKVTYIFFSLSGVGTGDSRMDFVEAITPDDELQDIPFLGASRECAIALAPEEGVWKPEVNTIANDSLAFKFEIWKAGDANCCPSAGEVTGKYKIIGDNRYEATTHRWPQMRMVVDSCSRGVVGGGTEGLEKGFRYLVPEGFTGYACVDFFVKDAPPLPVEDGFQLIVIPPDGKAGTSSESWDTRSKYDEYISYRGNPKNRQGPAQRIHSGPAGGQTDAKGKPISWTLNVWFGGPELQKQWSSGYDGRLPLPCGPMKFDSAGRNP